MLRTMPMIWSGKDAKCKEPCATCGRPLKATQFAVHVINGGNLVLHPDSEPEYRADGGEMGFHMVGPECRKKFGDFAVSWGTP